MATHSAAAEYDPLNAVRVHSPGLELWSGAVDPVSNLFEGPVAPERARRHHERLVAAFEGAGVEVHHLATDLAAAGALEDLVRDRVTVPDDADVDLDAVLATLDAHEKLGLALAGVRLERHPDAAASLHVERPISNVYFQRDTTILGDRGPILCDMATPVRRPEVPIVRSAWEGIGADVVHAVEDGPIEGGEFLPVGEFALLGVSGVVDGEEEVIRTSYAAGRELLAVGALGYEEVGLVRAPIEAEREFRAAHGSPSRLMHLLGWFNVAAEDLAVAFVDLARAATVDVYEKGTDGYERARSTDLLSYVEGHGLEVIDADPTERWPTNFVTVDDGEVVAVYAPEDDDGTPHGSPAGGDAVGGEYDPDRNPTIEALKERGVTVIPDGEGLPESPLTNGAGGFHCMTTPIDRG